MEIKNAADQDRAYKAEFPELPMQWKNYGYEITEKLGEGISGSVYKLVKNKGEADEEISALKMISWTLNKKMVYYYNTSRQCFPPCDNSRSSCTFSRTFPALRFQVESYKYYIFYFEIYMEFICLLSARFRGS